jgi:hypothetical protein
VSDGGKESCDLLVADERWTKNSEFKSCGGTMDATCNHVISI